MRVGGNHGSRLHYGPNSYGEWEDQPEYKEPSLPINGDGDRWNFREDDDNYFEQPGKLFNLMSEEQKQLLFDNTARNMTGVEKHIKLRHINHCYQADPAYGEGVAKAMDIP